MATSYTSSLRLVKQGDGANPNSWGTVLNDGVISLVDAAIADFDNTTTVISNNNKAKFVSINFILNPQ